MDGKYFNHLPHEVKFRKVWEPGAPPVRLAPGATIEGPVQYLANYPFLTAMPFPFHTVESETQQQNFSFKDMSVGQKTEPVIISGLPEQKTEPTIPAEPAVEPTVVVAGEQDLTKLPFDPKTVNWIMVKVSELELAAKVLNIPIATINSMKPKDKKWALVKEIKKALGMDIK